MSGVCYSMSMRMVNYQRAYPSARNNVDSILGMVECLHHGNEGWSGVSFLINTSQVVVHLNDTLIEVQIDKFQSPNSGKFQQKECRWCQSTFVFYPLIKISNFIHYPFKPIKWALLPSHPVEVSISGLQSFFSPWTGPIGRWRICTSGT